MTGFAGAAHFIIDIEQPAARPSMNKRPIASFILISYFIDTLNCKDEKSINLI